MTVIQTANQLNDTQDIMVGSADVKALNLSLNFDKRAEVVLVMFDKSEIGVEGVDSEEVGLCLTLNMDETELENKVVAQFCTT